MKKTFFGQLEYFEYEQSLKFKLEDYIFIKNLREKKDLDLDTLFEISFRFAEKHKQQLINISTKPVFRDFQTIKNDLHSSYFFAIMEKKNYDIKKQNINNVFDLSNNGLDRIGGFRDSKADEEENDLDEDDEEENDLDEDDEEEDDLAMPVLLSNRNKDGELFFLEPASILKPIRILKYSLKRPKKDHLNYRNWRPTNFTTDSHHLEDKYFYAYDPSLVFRYEQLKFSNLFSKSNLTQNYVRLNRTERYSYRRSVIRRYNPETRKQSSELTLRKRRAYRRNADDYKKKFAETDGEEDDDTIHEILDIDEIFDTYSSNFLVTLISSNLKKFSADIIFPDWFNILILFNLIFFFSDYVTIFCYWYFPYFLNLFYFEDAELTKTTHIYIFYIFLAGYVFLYFYILLTFFINNVIYKFYTFFFYLIFIFLFVFIFVFPFSIFFTIFMLFFLIFINLTIFFLQIFKHVFFITQSFPRLSSSTPKSNFGYYQQNFYFQTFPIRFFLFLNPPTSTQFKQFNFFKVRSFFFKPLKVMNSKIFIVSPDLDLRLSTPQFYPNTFSDISFQTALESRSTSPISSQILIDDEIPYNAQGPFSSGLTTLRKFLYYPSINYRRAPESSNPNLPENTSYQALFSLGHEWGPVVEDFDSHSQGYWYASSQIFSLKSLAIYHPYIIIQPTLLPFAKNFQLKIFLNSLQITNLSQPANVFSAFLAEKFLHSFQFSISPLSTNLSSTFYVKKIFALFKRYKVIYVGLMFFYLAFEFFYLILSSFFSIFFLISQNSKFTRPTVFQILFFPSIQNYYRFLKFYNQSLKAFNTSNIKKKRTAFIFFFFITFFSYFFVTFYYVRIRKISASFVSTFFHF